MVLLIAFLNCLIVHLFTRTEETNKESFACDDAINVEQGHCAPTHNDRNPNGQRQVTIHPRTTVLEAFGCRRGLTNPVVGYYFPPRELQVPKEANFYR